MGVAANETGFVHTARVHFDELDAMHMLHNARFFIHMERTASEFFRDLGRRWERDVASNPDQFSVVKAQRIEYLVPFLGTGDLRVEMWVEHVGRTSCTLAFLFADPPAATRFARGERTIVKLDPTTLRPTAWSPEFRAAIAPLVRAKEAGDVGA
jgi:acyl-CoA thioester hydrolase